MVEISDIKDKDSLREWLNTQPQEASVAIAARVALRVLPAHWRSSFGEMAREGDLTALPILRCCLISGVAATMPTPEIKVVAAASVANYTPAANYTSAASVAATSAFAASAAASAASAAASAANFASAFAANFASAFAATFTSAASVAAWQAVRADCSVLIQGEQPLERPLWPSDIPLADLWSEIRPKILSDDNWQPGDWSFWVNWYEQMLDPQTNPPNWPLLERIALIEPEVWEDGPEAVSKKIAEIEERFALADLASELRAELEEAKAEIAHLKQRSHNQPPELLDDFVAIAPSAEPIDADLATLERELPKAEPDKTLIRRAAERILAFVRAVTAYCGKVADKVIMTGAAAAGPVLADKLLLDGRLYDLAAKALQFGGG